MLLDKKKLYGKLFINCLFRWNRLERIKEMRWQIGSILPAEMKCNFSPSEVIFLFKFQITSNFNYIFCCF